LSDELQVSLHCIMCKEPIPPERLSRLGVTCSDACKKARKEYLKARIENRHCRYCHKPSTPEQRKRFQRWVRWEQKNPPPVEELDELERIAEAEARNALPRGRPKMKRPEDEPEPQRTV
jgi:predicted nucleic acid-binding Zn ribbon protein